MVANVIWGHLFLAIIYHWAPAQRFRLVSYTANTATTSLHELTPALLGSHLLTANMATRRKPIKDVSALPRRVDVPPNVIANRLFFIKSWYSRGTIEEIKAKESSPFRRPAEALTNDVTRFIQFPVFFFSHAQIVQHVHSRIKSAHLLFCKVLSFLHLLTTQI